jgi:hypothetical protein
MPAAVAVADPEVSVVALGQLESAPAEPDAFDHVLLAPAPPRDDPCARLAPPAE